MKVCYVMVGVPGSGKSTVAKRFRDMCAGKDVRVFSQDQAYIDFTNANHAGQWWSDNDTPQSMYRYAFRFSTMGHGGWDSTEPTPEEVEKRKVIKKAFEVFLEDRWKWALEGEILFNDRTNVVRKERGKYLREARAKGFKMIAIDVHVPLAVALERQRSRGDKAVPEDVIRIKYFQKQEMLLGSEVDFIIHVDGTGREVTGTIHL